MSALFILLIKSFHKFHPNRDKNTCHPFSIIKTGLIMLFYTAKGQEVINMDATLKKPRRKSAAIPNFAKGIVLQAVYFLLGLTLSLGAVFGELAPFGASLSAAVPLKFTGATVAGASVGYIFANPREAFRYVGVLLAIGALKWLLSDIKIIQRSPLYAPLLAFVPMLLTGIALLFVSSSKLSDLTLVIIEAVLSAVGGFFLKKTVELSESTRRLTSLSQSEVTCLTVAACIVIFSFGKVEIFSLSLGRILAVIAVLMLAKYGSAAMGSIGGIATGVLFSLSSQDLSFLPGSFALGGLLGGLCAPYGKLCVGVAFVLSSTVLAFSGNDKSLVFSVFTESLLGMGIFMMIPRGIENTLKAYFLPQKRKTVEDYTTQSVVARLKYASEAVEGVTNCITQVSRKLNDTYPLDEEEYIYEAAANRTCKSCGLKSYCYANQKEVTADDFRRVGKKLKEEGFISEKDIEEIFTKRCAKSHELAESFNEGYRDYLSALSAKNRITQVRSVVAGQFSGLSRMLCDLSEEFESAGLIDGETAREITNELYQMGAVVTACCVKILGTNRMTVDLSIAKSRSRDFSERDLRDAVEKVTGRPFDVGEITYEGSHLRLTLSEISPYDIEIGSSQHIAGNGKLCGDSLDYFLTGEGTLVAIISDGMGTGGAAAIDSTMAVTILTKLLKAGLSPDSALSVVNSSLMIKSEEESCATLDLLEANLFTGKVDLHKAGAPVTIIKRGGKILRREYPSLPVGILQEVKFMKDAVTLHEGDTILMVSDGALVGEEAWLLELVNGWRDASCADFASLVVNEAMKRRGDGHDDDITAIAMRLIVNE